MSRLVEWIVTLIIVGTFLALWNWGPELLGILIAAAMMVGIFIIFPLVALITVFVCIYKAVASLLD